MDERYLGIWIRQERLARNWSQEGLCKGVCAVSYLSKIEQGKCNPAPEVLRCLFDRLEIEWIEEPETLRRLDRLIDGLYDAVFSADKERWGTLSQQLSESWETCRRTPFLLDGTLLLIWCGKMENPGDLGQYEGLMDERQQTLFLDICERYDDLVRLHPGAFSFYTAGLYAYEKGSFSQAHEYLSRGYSLAAEEGRAFLMLECRVFLGNCCSNMGDLPRMNAHYQVARRLAQALKTPDAESIIRNIDYNIASTRLELGETEAAYGYFSRLENPSVMALHKLAICCEKLGKREEALAALDRAETAVDCLPPELGREICALVRYRLEHSDYLHDPAYGEKLLSCFEEMRRTLPSGYAGFHLPWVLEWYTENRLYKEAYQLLLDFPACMQNMAL